MSCDSGECYCQEIALGKRKGSCPMHFKVPCCYGAIYGRCMCTCPPPERWCSNCGQRLPEGSTAKQLLTARLRQEDMIMTRDE